LVKSELRGFYHIVPHQIMHYWSKEELISRKTQESRAQLSLHSNNNLSIRSKTEPKIRLA